MATANAGTEARLNSEAATAPSGNGDKTTAQVIALAKAYIE